MIAIMIPAIAPVAIPFLRLLGAGGDGVTVSSVKIKEREF